MIFLLNSILFMEAASPFINNSLHLSNMQSSNDQINNSTVRQSSGYNSAISNNDQMLINSKALKTQQLKLEQTLYLSQLQQVREQLKDNVQYTELQNQKISSDNQKLNFLLDEVARLNSVICCQAQQIELFTSGKASIPFNDREERLLSLTGEMERIVQDLQTGQGFHRDPLVLDRVQRLTSENRLLEQKIALKYSQYDELIQQLEVMTLKCQQLQAFQEDAEELKAANARLERRSRELEQQLVDARAQLILLQRGDAAQ